jgi:hypothetical protein
MQMDDDPAAPGEQPPDYQPPTIIDLGTLAELTRGGSFGPGDGFGSAGSSGSI